MGGATAGALNPTILLTQSLPSINNREYANTEEVPENERTDCPDDEIKRLLDIQHESCNASCSKSELQAMKTRRQKANPGSKAKNFIISKDDIEAVVQQILTCGKTRLEVDKCRKTKNTQELAEGYRK